MHSDPHATPLWEPKYAALGVAAIAVALFFLDLLPRLIAQKLDKATQPDPAPDLTSALGIAPAPPPAAPPVAPTVPPVAPAPPPAAPLA